MLTQWLESLDGVRASFYHFVLTSSHPAAKATLQYLRK
jgi:hypothetical protein